MPVVEMATALLQALAVATIRLLVVTSVTVPKEFMEGGAIYKYQVLAIEESGNQTISSAMIATQ
jgi:hypothetical protein